MAITALNSAATGLRALSTRIDVIANNLANSETTAFKRSRLNFEDLMYRSVQEPGVLNSEGQPSPAGCYTGLGVRIANTQLDLEQGSLDYTNRPLDVGIEGAGFLRVKIMDSIGDGYGYTRSGNFFINSNGELVIGQGDGYRIDPPIRIPADARELTISRQGLIQYVRDGSVTKQTAGQMMLYQFINPQGLKLQGGSIYTRTPASGEAVESRPGREGAGTILQGYLEGSNVDPVKELVSLIKTQRAFELNSQSIQTADQALQTVGNLRRY